VNVYTETVVQTPFRRRGPYSARHVPRLLRLSPAGAGTAVARLGSHRGKRRNDHHERARIVQATTIRVLLADKRGSRRG
jgi:hypothetical protein